jgi:hypothetical protein
MKLKSERVVAMDVESDPEPLHPPSLKQKKPSALISSNDDGPSKGSKATPPKKKLAVAAAASSSKPKPKAKPRSSGSTSAIAKSKVKSKKKAYMDDDYEDGDEEAGVKVEASDGDVYANEDLMKVKDERKKKPATKPTDTRCPKPTTDGKAKIKEEADQPEAEEKEQQKAKQNPSSKLLLLFPQIKN